MPRIVLTVTLAITLLVGACGTPTVEGVSVPDGFSVSEVVTGLERPTQAIIGSDGSLFVAQLAGGERDGTGQVLRIDFDEPSDPVVVADGLLVPTGLAVVADELWIMEQRTLTRRPLAGGEVEVVADELPFNGRSNGTLTVLGDGSILFDTSGSIRGGEVVAGSGRLWTVRAPESPVEYASGLKHAYAHTVDADGVLWATEVGDGSYDGAPPADELVAVQPGLDHGWPRCVGDNRPVAEYGGSGPACRDVPGSHAVFEPGATPTSVVVAPWDPDTLLVALWNRGEVLAVPRSAASSPHTGEVFLSGIEHPQHLVVDGSRLLVVDHGGGRVLAVSR